jgi:PAS domain S-box-containing protein
VNCGSLDYRALFEATPTPFLVLAPPDFQIRAVNDAYLRATLTERDAILGQGLFTVFPDDPHDPAPTGAANLRASLERVCAYKRADAMAIQRYPIRQKDGSYQERYWSPINTPVLDDLGNVILIIHRVEDVTQIVHMRDENEAQSQIARDQQVIIERLRETEAELRGSEQRFRIIADSSPVMMWVNDPSGRVQFVNKAYLDFFGVTEEDLKLHGWQPLLHPDDAPAYLFELGTAFREQRAFRGRTRVRHRDGAWRWLESYGAPRFDVNGVFLGLVGSSPDITDIVHAEQGLRDLDRRKDEFLALLAHELRNPLAPIRNGLEILSTTGLAHPAQQQAHQMMARQLKHLVRLVDDLLDVSRINRGKLEIRRKPVALASVLESAIETMQPAITQANHLLDLQMPPEPITVEADPVRLCQVFANLISNSVRYTPARGSIRITASIEGEEVKIDVEDNGSGLPAECLPTLFDAFSQVNSPLNRPSTGGLGLGLSLVKGLVEMHGGRVDASSPGIGQGSTFTVWLPRAAESAPLAETQSPSATATAERRRVLIVDDNRDAAASLATLLELLGHEVRQAHGGAESIEIAQVFRPQFIFMDLGMPGMNGIEASQRIRQLKVHPRPVIVALTGFGQDSDREQTSAAGFDGHLTKPAEISGIESLLKADRAPHH